MTNWYFKWYYLKVHMGGSQINMIISSIIIQFARIEFIEIKYCQIEISSESSNIRKFCIFKNFFPRMLQSIVLSFLSSWLFKIIKFGFLLWEISTQRKNISKRVFLISLNLNFGYNTITLFGSSSLASFSFEYEYKFDLNI